MSVETIIAIITAGIAFITSVASFTYNFIQNRKERIQKVILENRIKYMNEIREGFSCLIGLANAETIKYAQNNSEAMKVFSENLFIGYGKIKTHIKPFYKIDKELLVALDKLYDCILSTLNGDNQPQTPIDGLREDFADKYLKYDWAYWKYIQRQKEGNYMNSDDAFDKVYYEFVEEINKNSL
ncbi:MAG: hypothetical protein NC033_05105 [Clostridiales bacterium]|nr:hypothetical protein [Clostridiales bacterium]